MDKKRLERRLMSYSDGACVMTTKEFAKFYGISPDRARRKLQNAQVEKVSAKWFIPSIADKIYQNLM